MAIPHIPEVEELVLKGQLWLSKNDTRMTWFRAFRSDFGYSSYGESRTSVTTDIPLAAIIYSCILVSIATLVAAAGIRGKQRWYTLIRVSYSLAVGSIIAVSIFGYCWQLGDVTVHSPYIYRNQGLMEGSIGVRIGINTVNITLTGIFNRDGSGFKYNEELTLEDVLKEHHRLWEALDRGLPQPLLSVLDFFYVDAGAGLRFGRDVWFAGYLANILLWTSFAFWVAANVLLCSVIWYGAACFTLTGVVMVTTAVTYHALSPKYGIKMPCSEDELRLTYGWCYWSILVFGILTTVIGLLLFLLEEKVPVKLAEFFVLEKTLEDLDDYSKQSYSDGKWTPDTRDSPHLGCHRVHAERRDSPGLKRPTNWHINYGYDPHRQVDNPVYRDNDIPANGDVVMRHSDSSSRAIGGSTYNTADVSKQSTDDYRRKSDTDTARGRQSFSSIAEEEEGTGHCSFTRSVSSPVLSRDRKQLGANELHTQTVDRLSSIYVDIDGNTPEVNGVHRL